MGLVYDIFSWWKGPPLSAAEVGRRLQDMLRRLEPLSPAMRNWLLIDPPDYEYVPLDDAVPTLTDLVERNLMAGDWEGPHIKYGYGLVAESCETGPIEAAQSQRVTVRLNVSGLARSEIEFEIGDLRWPPDFDLITYPVYRGALEVIVSSWSCPWAVAYSFDGDVPPVDVPPIGEWWKRSPFNVAWIAYLSAPLAVGLKPPPDLISEPTPGGGVILSAVQTVIDQSNPDHMRRSRVLETILTERVGSRRPDIPPRVGPY